MAKQQALNDTFDTNSLSALWNAPGQLGGAVVSNINKRIEIALPASSTATTDGFIASAATYDLTGSFGFVQVVQVANQTTSADTTYWLKLDANNWVRWTVEAGTIFAQKMVAGVKTTVFSTGYISGTHQWWKIWESGGTIFFDTSADGITWTNRGSTTVSFAITGLQTTLEASCFQNETNPGTVIYDNFNTPGVIISGFPKTYTYHVFKSGAFQGTLNNVISDFEYQQEINSTGSTITITLASAADSYGEGTLVDFNNEIDIYVIDDQVPNGLLIFKGFIVNYQPIYTDTDQEQVILTVMGFGATMNDYILESAETTDVNQNSQNTSLTMLPTNQALSSVSAVQSFTIGAGVSKLSALSFWLAVHSIEGLGQTVLLQVFSAQADAESGGLTSLIGSVSLPISSLTAQAYKFTFATALTVTSGNVYWARLSMPNAQTAFDRGIWAVDVYYDNTSPYPGGILETITYNGSIYTKATVSGDAYIITYQSAGNTQFSFNSVDPSIILKAVLDNYAAQGGKINYTSASIDLTSTVVSYTFNANTVFEAVNKCLSLAPVGWYFYIDQVNNVLHFHKVSSTASHTFAMSKNIRNLAIEKRAQDIVNVVYFIGGPTAGVNLYNKYILQTSIDLYGRHAIRYTDNNVTLASTAQIIANSILSNQGQAELRVDLDILDNGGQASSIFGFNIESLTLGESVSFRSIGPGSGGSLWDQAKWDISKWDFDITDLSSIVVQVTRMEYKPNILHLSLSTVPPDITKRIQDIYRNLSQLNVLNNPAAPS